MKHGQIGKKKGTKTSKKSNKDKSPRDKKTPRDKDKSPRDKKTPRDKDKSPREKTRTSGKTKKKSKRNDN
jgi:hypothetical protein